MKSTRRTFCKQLASCGLVAPWLLSPLAASGGDGSGEDELSVHIFSKHLHFLSIREAAEMGAELGFSGLDLTVRPNGHVLPASAPESLPQAIREIEAGGSTCRMITTSIESATDPVDRELIAAASAAGIRYYRTNWFRYLEGHTMPESLDIWREEVRQLAALNEQYNITACYQNHAGTKIGASYWEISQLLEGVAPDHFGVQYDIRHATAEGALSWENGLRLLRGQIQTIVLKDFKWAKAGGQWELVNVPIGEGMVDFTRYFRLLKAYQINVPVSLHLEYPLGGAEKGRFEIDVDRKVVYDAMSRDLERIRELWRAA